MLDVLRIHNKPHMAQQTRNLKITFPASESTQILRALSESAQICAAFLTQLTLGGRRSAQNGGAGGSHRLHPRVYRASWIKVVLRKARAGGVVSIHTRFHAKHAVRDHYLFAAAAATTAAVVIKSTYKPIAMLLHDFTRATAAAAAS